MNKIFVDDHLSFPYSSRANNGNSHHCSTTSSICSYNSDNEETSADHILDHLKVFNDDKAIAYRPLNPMVKNLLGADGSFSEDENSDDFQSIQEDESSPFAPHNRNSPVMNNGRIERNNDSESFCREFKNLTTHVPPYNPAFSIPSSACTTAEKSSFIQVNNDLSIDSEGAKHDDYSPWGLVSTPTFHLGVSDLTYSSGRVRTKKRHRTPTTCSPLLPAINNHGDGSNNNNNNNNNGRSRSSSLSTSSHHNLNSSTSCSSSPNFLFRSIHGSGHSSALNACMTSTQCCRDSPHSQQHMEGICLAHGASSLDCITGENTCTMTMTDVLPFSLMEFSTTDESSSSSCTTTSIVNGFGIGGNAKGRTPWDGTTVKEVLPSNGPLAASTHTHTHTYTPNTDTTTTTSTTMASSIVANSKQLPQRKFKRHALMQPDEVASFYAQSNLLNDNMI